MGAGHGGALGRRRQANYRVSFRTARAIQRKPVLKNQKKKKMDKENVIYRHGILLNHKVLSSKWDLQLTLRDHLRKGGGKSVRASSTGGQLQDSGFQT
jgi:hypothetical protein